MSQIVDIRKLSRACIQELSRTLITERKNRVTQESALDSSQQQVVESQAQFVRVVAPAGSGKTRTLLAKAFEVLNSNRDGHILCLTFTNAAAKEFEDRARKLDPSLSSRLKVSTLNAFGYDSLRIVNKALQVISPNSRTIGGAYKILKELMSESEIWGKKAQSQLYAPILELTDMTKSLGFDHHSNKDEAQKDYDRVDALGMTPLLHNLLAEIEIEGSTRKALVEKWFPFWQKFCDSLWRSHLITLEDQKYWALNQLTNQISTQNRLRNKQFTHVLVDEFQDINILDILLISQIVHTANTSLIIVGDDDQCIYEWRGCTSIFIQKPDDFFNVILNGKKFEKILLENNYRCPRNIVIHSKKLIDHNSERVSKEMIPMRNDDANIRIISLPAAYLTMNVVDELVADIVEHHPNHTVAIVGRKKCQLIPIQILLTRRGTKFAIDTDLNVFGGKAFQDFRHFLELPRVYTQTRTPIKNIQDMLALLDRVKKTPVSKQEREEIEKWLSSKKPQTLHDTVALFGQYEGQFKRGYAKPDEVSADLRFFLERNSVVSSLHAASNVFKGFQKDFVKSKEDIFYSDPPFSHLADLAVNYEDDLQSFLRDIDRAIERAAANDPRGAKVELMTALRTKGREFDTVIVLDVNDGIWPNKKSLESGRIEEERRLFYVTVTRTKNNLLLFESGRVQGQQLSTSPFIQEMDLPDSAWLSHPHLDQISYELLTQLKV